MAEYTNTAESTGLINEINTDLTGVTTIQLVDGLLMTKSADKESWADGLLTFTIVIDNVKGTEPYEGVTITDTLDPLILTLVTDSVKLNDEFVSYTFNDASGVLIIADNSPFTVAAGDIATITFQVQKVTNP